MKGLDLEKGDADIRLLTTMQRATMDAFWARDPSTVEATRRDSKKLVEISQSLGLDDTLPEMVSFCIKGYSRYGTCCLYPDLVVR